MKINIGKYPDYFGPYQLTDTLKYFGVSEDTRNNIAEKIPSKPFEIINSLFKRKVKVKIDDFDTWSMDHTLALIILPMLKNIKAQKNGIPVCFLSKEYNDITTSKEYYTEKEDGKLHKKSEMLFKKAEKNWDDILDKMIWSFEQILEENWEEQYWIKKPILDLEKRPGDEDKEVFPVRWLQKGECDWDGLKKHQKRIQEGLNLFGKHYLNLWT
jgi:hypothetical protein